MPYLLYYSFISSFPLLTFYLDLKISGCTLLTNRSLFALATATPHLEIFEASDCDEMTDTGLEVLLKCLPKLTHVDLECVTRLTDKSVRAMAVTARGLRHVVLSYCEHVREWKGKGKSNGKVNMKVY